MNKLEIFKKRSLQNSIKWSQSGRYRVAMGIADMDFKPDKRITQGIKKFVDVGDFGYNTYLKYNESVIKWMKKRFDWHIKNEWITFSPGTLSGIAVIINILSKEKDSIMVFSPVYNRFLDIINCNNRHVVQSRLVNNEGSYSIDFINMEENIISENVKILILSSPHNPICRVWTIDEQQKIKQICKKHQVFIISDEIHADLVMPGYSHSPFLKNNMDYSNNIIVTTSPSKSFNIAGLYIANFIIPDESVRKRYLACLWTHPNIVGCEALKIAYDFCEDWLDEVNSYLYENFLYIEKFLLEKIPIIKIVKPQATYLAWLDCRNLNLSQAQLMDFFMDKAKVYVSDGLLYGIGSEGFVRMNIACSDINLQKALNRIYIAAKSYDIY